MCGKFLDNFLKYILVVVLFTDVKGNVYQVMYFKILFYSVLSIYPSIYLSLNYLFIYQSIFVCTIYLSIYLVDLPGFVIRPRIKT